ncbi:unnamed protein product, partial [Schistosoma intercalatum]
MTIVIIYCNYQFNFYALQTEELTRLRSTNQEQVTRIGHLEMKLDEKGHQLKSQTSEI